MKPRKPDKGGAAEEALRAYFTDCGYFAVRGVKLRFDSSEITDLDVWLYMRASSIHRIRAAVDAKNRSTPRALERILWARGLQAILGLDDAIVATTDNREIVKSFGSQQGVRVLDGKILSQIVQQWTSQGNIRIGEEELLESLSEGGSDRLYGQWLERVDQAKSRLLTKLNFSGCNAWLEDLRYFLDAFGSGKRCVLACRCAYLMTSYFLIGMDFRLVELPTESEEKRRDVLFHGFALGEGGKERLTAMTALMREYRPDVAREISAYLPTAGSGRPAMLADYFSRLDVMRTLFSTARSFEALAYTQIPVPPDELEPTLKSVLAVLADALEIDRGKILERRSGRTS